jgi:hypothetical protein
MHRALGLLLLVGPLSCGGATFEGLPPDDGGGSGGDDSGKGDGGVGTDGGANDGGLSPVCPAQVPATSSACSRPGVTCEYGTDPDYNCNTRAQCNQQPGGYAFWNVQSPGIRECPTPPNPAACPATFGAVPQGSSCSTQMLVCWYPQGECGCVPPLVGPVLLDAGNDHWVCAAPANCPSPRPKFGSPCTQDGQVCDYGSCGRPPSGVMVKCEQGVWTPQMTPCPAAG